MLDNIEEIKEIFQTEISFIYFSCYIKYKILTKFVKFTIKNIDNNRLIDN